MHIKNYYNSYTQDNIVFDNGVTPTESVYSDRLYQWNAPLHRELSLKHFQREYPRWSQESTTQIESFLSEYFAKPNLVLCKIIQEENKSNGNPLWVFQCAFK